MSYSCGVHGWRHLLNPCPHCYEVTTDNTLSAPKLRDIITQMDGVAAVNLSEPSEGDLERVVNAYRDLRLAYKDELERADKNARRIGELATQLAEVTRERDELKKALAGWGQDAQEVRTILAAEQIKAERYREALKLVEKETIEMGIHGLVIYVQQALTEAEGE